MERRRAALRKVTRRPCRSPRASPPVPTDWLRCDRRLQPPPTQGSKYQSVVPSKRTTRWRAASYAMACDWLIGGDVVGMR
ncbi:MAG: hypothetical protein ACK55Z_23335, partial [bacterium]